MVTILLEDGEGERFDSYQPPGNGWIRCRCSDPSPRKKLSEPTEYYKEFADRRRELRHEIPTSD